MADEPPSSDTGAPNQKDPPRSEPCAQPQGDAVRHGSYTILVIDDDAVFRQFVSSALRKYGIDVLTASSGVKGLNMLNTCPRDIPVVLLDYTMPQFDGTETLRHLRNLKPSIKVVAVTSSRPQVVSAGFRDGVDAYIEKPVNPLQLIWVIDSLVGSKPTGSHPGSLASSPDSAYGTSQVRAAGAPRHATGCRKGNQH
jgi:CheY-like chemotaxis protein